MGELPGAGDHGHVTLIALHALKAAELQIQFPQFRECCLACQGGRQRPL